MMDLEHRHISTQQIAQFFEYSHLPSRLQEISAPLCEVAEQMIRNCPDSPELTFGLRQLLLAKDAFVRAAL
jgi:hypothetical protein